jgi:hypothetical protein
MSTYLDDLANGNGNPLLEGLLQQARDNGMCRLPCRVPGPRAAAMPPGLTARP